MKNVLIVGGGIIGLSSALYLKASGFDVTVIDKSDFLDNCSYGNAGYVCPSHFIPLATPGIVKQGFKWMLNSKSPFYVQPRLSRSLLEWGIRFIQSATAEKVEKAAIPLRDIALLSQKEYETWARTPGFEFAYEHKGLLEIFQTEAKREHAIHALEKARELGLGARMLDESELHALEPGTKIRSMGAVIYDCDSHLYPNRLMRSLMERLKSMGVRLIPNEEVKQFETAKGLVRKLITTSDYDVDQLVVATGSWSREIAFLLETRIPMVPGRGYSITLENPGYMLNHPAVLMESRVAITPMDGNKMRFGGTMEITSTTSPPRMNRVLGIIGAVKKYFPDFEVPVPSLDKVWYGFRPCSADGLPYIGRIKKFRNVVIATGHSMLGLSLGAGTGKLVDEIICEKNTSMDISPFAVERFS